MAISEEDEACLQQWLGLDEPDHRVPLVTISEARAVVLLLQQLADDKGPAGWAARDVAGRIARRLPGD